MTDEERRREHEYRRGYCDGWLEGAKAVLDGIPEGTLARLGERGRQVYAAYTRAERHWSEALNLWAAGDCGISILPPEMSDVDEAPGLSEDDEQDGGDLDELAGVQELEGVL